MRKMVLERQEPLRQRYRSAPEDAWIRDHARTEGGASLDPFHARVVAGEGEERWPVGNHRAIGGFHDQPNPGEILSAALASCYDTTLRMLAERLGIPIEDVEVRVTAEVDVRGTLAVDREVPVGFQRMACRLRLRPGPGVPEDRLRRLAAAAERACIVMQTLRHGVPVRLETDFDQDMVQDMREGSGAVSAASPGGGR